MRITQLGKFYLPHHGGIESYLHEICKALKDETHLRVLVSNDYSKTEDTMVEGVQVRRLATYGTIASTPITPGFFGEIRSIHEGIIHLHHPNPLPTVWSLLCADPRVKIVVSYHADIVNQRILKYAFFPFLHGLLRRCAAIIASSSMLIDRSETLRPFREKCHVIPFPIDSVSFRGRICAVKVKELRAKANRPIVLSIGRLVPYKGFEYLITAMKEVDAELWIIGEGPLRDQLNQQGAALSGKVRLLGSVPDVANYHAASDVFVLSSINRSEAYGIVQMEAMAAGKPVVNTLLESGVPYVSKSGESGLTVPPADPKALSKAINILLSDPKMREEMGRNGMLRVASEFDVSRIKQQTLEVYRAAARA